MHEARPPRPFGLGLRRRAALGWRRGPLAVLMRCSHCSPLVLAVTAPPGLRCPFRAAVWPLALPRKPRREGPTRPRVHDA